MPRGIPKNGVNNGWFKKGSSGPWLGKKRLDMTGEKHYAWKGGKPKCEQCGKQLQNRRAKRCRQHPSEEHKKKMGLARKGRFGDEKHPAWKGDRAGYNAIHMWVRRKLGGKMICSHCKTRKAKRFEWANISRKYTRKLSDWIRLCSRCHGKFDTGHRRKLKIKTTKI